MRRSSPTNIIPVPMSEPCPLLITKASGELVPFDREKLKASLEHAGATAELSTTITDAVVPKLHNGISTRKLHRLAFGLLHRRSRNIAARYRLKQAIMELGPSGFPFERFFERILANEGYRTNVGVVVHGKCVDHEVDVIADKGDQKYLVECKYHNTPGRVCDVKVPLYIKARFDDVAPSSFTEPDKGPRFTQGWLVTNTRFTSDALQYGLCVGLGMISWDQPKKGSLKDSIDRSGLYPLTCLGSLSRSEKERLLEQGLVLAQDVLQKPDALTRALVQVQRIERVLAEAAELCTGLNELDMN